MELANANGGRDKVSVIFIHVAKPYPIESRGGLLERIVSKALWRKPNSPWRALRGSMDLFSLAVYTKGVQFKG